MPKLIWVQAQPTEQNLRKVVLNEYDDAHPTENHEVWIVAYEDPRFDADGHEIEANPPVQVADTAGVRRAILAGDLAEVGAPMARQQAARSATASADAERRPDPVAQKNAKKQAADTGEG